MIKMVIKYIVYVKNMYKIPKNVVAGERANPADVRCFPLFAKDYNDALQLHRDKEIMEIIKWQFH